MVDETTVRNQRAGGKTRFVLGFIAASALWIVLILGVLGYWKARESSTAAAAASTAVTHTPAATPSPVIHEAPGTLRNVTAMVAQRLAALHVPPRKATLPADLAMQTETAIKQGDFATADRIAGAVLASSKLTGWTFYPFTPFMNAIVGPGNDPQLQSQLHEWREREPQSALAHLISAQYFERTGWAVRGSDDGAEVPAEDMRLFEEDLATATSEARQSVSLNPHDPWSYLLLLHTVSRGDSAAVEAVFQEAIHAFPTYYPLYVQRLYMLTPKWGGSVEAMYAFVDRYAGSKSSSSPLRLLYLQLYGYLANAAYINCASQDGSASTPCMQTQLSRMASKDIDVRMVQALKLYKVSDHVAYSNALWPILGDMLSLPQSNDWSGLGAVLQVAGKIMGSDEQLSDHPGHNDYVLDDIDARIWAQIGNNYDADQKFQEAIGDIERTSFADEARKDQALATIYDHMMDVAADNKQWINVIAYQAAENDVGGARHSETPWETCIAYHAMKLQDEAVKECTRLLDTVGNYMEARYCRAHSYEAMHDWDAALADFAPIADGAGNWYRVGAAQDISYIYGEKHDYAAELASLNQHAYLFDPSLQAPADLAVSFNNRCYAYMQLGHLHRALADCTVSLRYGHIPDAYHKQLELMARLGIKPTL